MVCFNDSFHDNAPDPFNLDFRPRFAAAVSKAYSLWSYAHPNHSQEEGQAAYQRICAEQEAINPTHRELKQRGDDEQPQAAKV